jgi:hypothetical protein
MSSTENTRETHSDEPVRARVTHGEVRRDDADLTTADLAGQADGAPAETRTFAEARPATPDGDGREGQTPLFPSEEAGQLRERWTSIQAGFVDEPRRAVEDADGLVAQAMKRLAETFAEERQRLEGAWDRGDDVSTEDLRLALQRYRSFFGRLLAV